MGIEVIAKRIDGDDEVDGVRSQRELAQTEPPKHGQDEKSVYETLHLLDLQPIARAVE
jgi:hypothetical protein